MDQKRLTRTPVLQAGQRQAPSNSSDTGMLVAEQFGQLRFIG